ncbi:MAG: PSD1 and planctomycete cytochrome C domain-containing protein [Verrucomicrobiota bacterium]
MSALAFATSAAAEKVDFNRDVRPILAAKCFACHGQDPETRDAGLRLDVEEEAKKDLGGYAAIAPNQPEQSEAWLRIDLDADDGDLMPPKKAKKDLTAEEKSTLKRWIEQGAPYAKHWAYEEPKAAPAPEIRNPKFEIRNRVDAFVAARLIEAGLASSKRAEPHQLIRRVSLDLIGLPPSPDEVDAFVAAWKLDSDAAYQQLLDRLFESPRFGEKWARGWLDLARYADSNGFQADQLRDSWAYRDWVINAFNEKMPFDQFTIEQLAGDLLPNATLEQKIATGFHRTVTCNVEAGVHPEENRVNQVVDRVNTTGTVWLGMSMSCAQCHDHKYDPITMVDYYSMFAFFNQTPVEVRNPSGKGVSFDFYGPKMELPMSPEKEEQRKQLQEQIEALEKKREPLAAEAKKTRKPWEAALVKQLGNEPQWKYLDITEFQGTQKEGSKDLGDNSILVTGKVPDKTTYTVSAKGDLAKVSAIRLETLAHDSLPTKGPARGNGSRPNSIVNEFRLFNAAGESVALSGAVADFNQTGYTPDKAIDGDKNPKSGWAINPQFGRDHWIAFRTGKPVDVSAGIRVEIDQTYGGQRVVGRLRLSVLEGEMPALKVPDNIAAIVRKEAKKRDAKERKALDTYFAEQNPELQALEKEIAAVKKKLAAVEPDTTLVMVKNEEVRETHIMMRGNYLSPGEKVEPNTPAVLHPLDPQLPKDRLGFAKWLMSTDNPLVARVTVNRWWQEMMGLGIVATLEDFGATSEPPTHPELLDWLSVEFMESGWDMRHVLRLIVESSTYRQSSRVTPQLLEADPKNQFYARAPRFRMTAEMIRDTGLTVSGLLSTKMEGKPVMPFQPPGMWRQVGRNEPKWVEANDEDRFRRGVYIVYRRAAPYPSFVNFDATDRSACVVSRGRTNTPLQALTLMNDPAFVEMAVALADRVLSEKPNGDFDARLDHAYRLVLQRLPYPAERQHLRAMFDERVASIDEMAAKLVIDQPAKVVKPKTNDQQLLAAWFYVANVLLNLDETISKG